METVVTLEGVTICYRRRGRLPVTALDSVCLTLRAGERCAIHGASGSGKSTLLLCAGGLLRPDSGDVTLAGERLYALSSEARSAVRARHIGFVFQQFHLIPYLNVLDNVLVPSLAAGGGADPRPRAEALIERFGLRDRRLHPPSELSIGERQRVALARALLLEPQVLLADEPTGNLDEENGMLVMEALGEFAQSGGAVLVVTHDRRISADRICRLEAGVLTDSAGP